MPTKRKQLHQLAEYIDEISDGTKRAGALALFEVAQKTKLGAVKNVKKNFGKTGSKRIQTGGLMNSIFASWDTTWVSGKIRAFIGTRGIPYGKIHELGGIIEPKKAKNLWVRLDDAHRGSFKRLTPTEFMQKKMSDKTGKNYKFIKGKRSWIAAYQRGKTTKLLFALRDRVDMKARPYLRPAILSAMGAYDKIYQKHITMEVGK